MMFPIFKSKVGFIVLLIFVFTVPVWSQSNYEKAQTLLTKAALELESGAADLAISTLKEARVLDPKNYIYDYEIGYALYLKRDYKEALKTLKYVVYSFDNCTDQAYQLLGNVYSLLGNNKNAFKTYTKGIVKFPNSGRLYLEKGIYYLIEKNQIKR